MDHSDKVLLRNYAEKCLAVIRILLSTFEAILHLLFFGLFPVIADTIVATAGAVVASFLSYLERSWLDTPSRVSGCGIDNASVAEFLYELKVADAVGFHFCFALRFQCRCCGRRRIESRVGRVVILSVTHLFQGSEHRQPFRGGGTPRSWLGKHTSPSSHYGSFEAIVSNRSLLFLVSDVVGGFLLVLDRTVVSVANNAQLIFPSSLGEQHFHFLRREFLSHCEIEIVRRSKLLGPGLPVREEAQRFRIIVFSNILPIRVTIVNECLTIISFTSYIFYYGHGAAMPAGDDVLDTAVAGAQPAGAVASRPAVRVTAFLPDDGITVVLEADTEVHILLTHDGEMLARLS
ncbi:hypothetical protein PG995_012816 [Apiospora arundinis]